MRSPGQSIRNKLMLVVLATTVAALVVVAIALVVYESRTYERSTADDLMTQAQILGRATAAALVFDDPVAARENLAVLKVQPQIRAAAIYTQGGRLFANYGATDVFGPGYARAPQADGYEIEGERDRRLPADRRGRRAARHRVSARALRARPTRLRDYLGDPRRVVLVASLAFALLLSAAPAARVTRPIIAVTDVARQVIERRDFSLRVEQDDARRGRLSRRRVQRDARRGRPARRRARGVERDAFARDARSDASAEEALRVADRRKDEFLAMLAHELRNPLAPMRNALEILQRSERRRAGGRRKRARMMERQLRQMVRLVDDLLDVSRITTGKLALKTRAASTARRRPQRGRDRRGR